MIRPFKGMKPTIPATCYVDDSAQIIGDVVLGEHASVWMNAVVRAMSSPSASARIPNIQDCSVLHGMKNTYGLRLRVCHCSHSVTLHGCTVEDRCLIGMGAIILNGRKSHRIHHRRRHPDPGAHRSRARLSLDGIPRQVPP